MRTILVIVSRCLRSNERSSQKVFLSPRKESHSLLGVIISKRDYTGQILLLLLLNYFQICLTTLKLQPSYISCKMFIREFVPAGRIQLTNTSKGESKHFEVSVLSLCLYLFCWSLKCKKWNVKIVTEISLFLGNSKLLFPN